MGVGLHFLLKNRRQSVQIPVLLLLSLIGPISLVYDFVVWGPSGSYLEYLPLHMCAYNAILTPILVITKNRFLGNLVPLFSVGAILALLFNSIQAEYSLFSMVFLMYYLSHSMGSIIPFLMFSLGHIKTHPKYILPCVGATMGIYTVSHIANLIINEILKAENVLSSSGELIQVNYMFSVHPQGNPLLQIFWNIIPFGYFYMFCAIPIAALYFLGMNLPSILKKKTWEA